MNFEQNSYFIADKCLFTITGRDCQPQEKGLSRRRKWGEVEKKTAETWMRET